ncbi:MAG: hypothetical protein HYU58_09400 [Proteobacteria bacterium]|nr:hypothetical protein [Pseudomonadota bacterium]
MRRSLILSVSLLALAGCTSDKQAEVPAPAPANEAAAPAPSLDARFAGTWYVSGVFPSVSQAASVADPHLGSVLVIGEGEVSDVNGQRCVTPAFATDTVAAEKAGPKIGSDAPWERLSVTCDGHAFATYLRLPDQTGDGPALLQQRPEGLYLLEQAAALQHRRPSELVEAPRTVLAATTHEASKTEKTAARPAEPAPKKQEPKKLEAAKTAPTPMAEGPVEASAAEPVAKTNAKAANGKLPAPGTAMHLASYKGQSAAKRGWKILLGEYDELDPLSPLYVNVDVPGKGEMIRLYATGVEPAEIAKICAALKAKKVYCALNP